MEVTHGNEKHKTIPNSVDDNLVEQKIVTMDESLPLWCVCVCVCVLASGYGWGTVMHEIPISSSPILMTSLPYPRTQ